MIEINPHLLQSLLKSSLPLLFGGSCYFLKDLFSESSSQKVSDKNLHFRLFQSNDGLSSEDLEPDFLALLDQISLGIYSNFATFLFVMLLLDGLFKIVKPLWRGTKSSRTRFSAFNHGNKKWKLFNVISENQIKRIFSYAVIFMILQIAGLFWSLVVQDEILTHHSAALTSQGPNSETLSQINLMVDQQDQGIPRILEEEEELNEAPSSSPMVPEKLSLSMGNVLGSLNLDVNAMVLSKDKKIAFVTIDFYGTLKILDISDLKSPLVVASLNLRVSEDEYRLKNLILSTDEKTLYASNSKDLEIIDISNLRSPKLISETRIRLTDGYGLEETVPSFKTSLAVSENTKTLYIGGLGLQVFDISDPKKPVLLSALKNDVNEDKGINVNEICLSRDERILFVANGTLNVYNTSNPKDMKLLHSFETESSPRSLILDEESKTVLLLGTSENNEIVFEEADVSSLDSFKVKKTFKLDYRSDYSPRFLAVSPSKSKLFLFAYSNLQGDVGLLVFDRIKHTTKKNEDNLVEETFALEFGPDGKTVITASSNQFMTIELFLDYPNSQIFSPSQENLIKNISFPLCEQMQVSADGQYLFALCKAQKNSFLHVLTIWDVKNLSEPRSLYNTQKFISQMRFSRNYQTVYLMDSDSIIMLDIAKRDEIKLKKSYKLQNQNRNLAYFIPSSDEKTGFIIRNLGGEMGSVSFIDLSSDSGTIDVFLTLDLEFKVYNSRLILKDDDKTLIVLGQKMVIYDISKTLSPKEISSLPFGGNESDLELSSYLLSPDKQMLFVETFDENRFFQLKIYNISISASPELISEKYFPKLQKARAQPGLSLSPDLKTGYLFHQANSLIKLNLTDLKQPQIAGVIPIAKGKQGSILSYVMSPDGKTIYAADSNQIRVINTEIEYTLFLKQEKFLLGGKYSDKIAMLRLSEFEYDVMTEEPYKIIKLSLLDMKVAPNKVDLAMKTSPLPNWMTFDRESNTLTVESKKQSEIGKYTLCSAFSLKISREAFQDLGTSSDDIWAWLISLDYVDPQMYLTENFGGMDEFFLPSILSRYTKKIYEILKNYRVETCTSFEVVSSLQLNNKSLPTISSLSTSPIKAEIKLEPKNGVDAKFVNRPYGSLLPIMKDHHQDKISLEGSIKELNTALNSIVVNFENGTSCDASMIIIDGLNPPVSAELENILSFIQENQPPSVNKKVDKTVQEQIDGADIQTGKYFIFTFSNDIFEDKYAEKNLEYEVVMATNDTAFPLWLSVNGLTLKGTPPEEISGRTIDLILIAKNEFKKNQIPFRLHISISTVFWLKLVMRYIPYILTLLGLFVSANKIFNVLRKGFYKHSKEFYIGIGEEISEDVIFPVSFINEEQKQSDLILKQFREKEVADFIAQDGEVLEKERIFLKIKEAIQTMPLSARKQITLYPSSIIDQIIINKFVWMQLDSEQERKTRSLFEDLGPSCLEVVERDSSSGFIINQSKLNQLIKSRAEKTESLVLEESLISHDSTIPGVNVHLLKDAILAFTFENHSLDISPIAVDIAVKQQVPSNLLFRFLKFDLKEIFLDYRNKMNYGINYQIIDDKLCFYGIAQNYFKGKTIVVQIKNKKQRIMKEIWIHGVSDNLGKNETNMIRRDEQEMRGQGYEVY